MMTTTTVALSVSFPLCTETNTPKTIHPPRTHALVVHDVELGARVEVGRLGEGSRQLRHVGGRLLGAVRDLV